MVYVTEAARQYLRALRTATQRTRPGTTPRIATRARGQLGLYRGIRTSRDTVLYHEDVPLLLLEPSIAAALDRTVIHCRRGRRGPQLVITLLRATPEDQRREEAPAYAGHPGKRLGDGRPVGHATGEGGSISHRLGAGRDPAAW